MTLTHKALYSLLAAASLSACISPPQGAQAGLRPFPDSPDPIVDASRTAPDSLASFPAHKLECRRLQEQAMPFSFLDAFGSSDVKAYERRRADEASAIMRRCLQGRGFQVLN